ncbi:MAG: hypothetical protein A2V91_02360 [Candidatus Muproteobacteria bacterium RBG_16_64_10]|uniref:DUF4124 domain-containing protein n=1 Tax=Candidatus Muproteobacteria bacterium RBG_16_64_10 TaxID=1817757 RepID=A0A1F6T3H9_9PROT|nr:MAG: hypothetical protein A2V91_02360 [Candidatus Muproteobacteria bacterium RBG_16_64_10]
MHEVQIMRRFYLFPLLSLLLLPLAATAADATSSKSIRKCQDASGKWHYGDSAAEECAKSKITEISEKGTKKKEIAAPPTEEELKAREQRKDELEQEQKLTAAKKRRDELLLSTYGHEDDIIYTRDRKLAQIDSSIKASEDTLKSLRAALARLEGQAAEESRGGKALPAPTAKSIDQTKKQIETHEAAIRTRRQEQEAVRKQAAADLERYRELKKAPVKQPAPDKKKTP